MTTKINRIPAALLALAFFIFLPIGLAQQPAPTPDAKPRPHLTLRIALADARSPLRELVVQCGEKVFHPVLLNAFQISEAVALKAMPEQMNFYIKGTEDPAAAIASVAIPAGVQHALVVLAPNNGQAKPSHQAFLVNEADFPDQSIWFLNGSPKPVAIQIEAASKSIPAGATQLLRPDHQDGKPLSVQTVFFEKDKWRIFSSTRWVLPVGQRHLVFFHINPRTQRMDYNSLTDFISN